MDETPLQRWQREEAARKAEFRRSHPNHRVITRGTRKGQIVKLTRSERIKERRLETERQKLAMASPTSGRATQHATTIKHGSARSPGTRIWAWGVNSQKHPTYELGLFPWMLMMLVGLPVLGLLYKLSFGILGPIMMICFALGVGFYRKMKR